MRILVTGAAGFIGQHLTEGLRDEGFHVDGVDRVHGDLRQHGVINSLLDRTRPDVCVHLAAKVGRLFGEDDPAATVLDNAGMTSLVAQACGDRGVRLVYASTSEVYGDRGDTLCSENDPLDMLPHNLYGLSKRWGEEACRLYAPERLLLWRISMPYGPGLLAGRGRAAIINFLDQAQCRVPIPVHRGSERSWCWIGDTVRAMRMTLATEGGVFNVGRDDDPLPMTDVAGIACALTGAPYSLIEEVDPPAGQTVVKRLSTVKLRGLGWEPRVELREGMERTLAAMNEPALAA